jgi:predicted secreted protein
VFLAGGNNMSGKTGKIVSAIVLGQLVSLAQFMTMALAGETEQYDIISIQAQRSMEVDNDLMYAELSVEIEGKEPAMLAGKINEVMTWALSEARKSDTIDVMSGNYYVHAVYDNNKITHWRANQILNLKSKDVTGMTRLIGILQGRMMMKSMGFGISSQKKDEIENELITKALDAFKERATIVTGSLQAKGYRIVNISIDTPGAEGPPRPLMRAMAMAMEGVVAAPAVEPGMSNITVVVSGAIQLQ